MDVEKQCSCGDAIYKYFCIESSDIVFPNFDDECDEGNWRRSPSVGHDSTILSKSEQIVSDLDCRSRRRKSRRRVKSTTKFTEPNDNIKLRRASSATPEQADETAMIEPDPISEVLKKRHPCKEMHLFTKLDYHALGQLQNKLAIGITVKRISNSDCGRVILGTTSKFHTLTITSSQEKHFPWINDEKTRIKVTPDLGFATEIRAGTDPDPSFPGDFGTLAVRAKGGDPNKSLSILWPKHSLHIEFDSVKECFDFTLAVRLWRSVLG